MLKFLTPPLTSINTIYLEIHHFSGNFASWLRAKPFLTTRHAMSIRILATNEVITACFAVTHFVDMRTGKTYRLREVEILGQPKRRRR